MGSALARIVRRYVVLVLAAGLTLGPARACDATAFKRILLALDGAQWSAARDRFSPVEALLVQNRALWVRTYAAEYNTVRVRAARGRLWLKPLMFLIPAPGGGGDQPAFRVKSYAGGGVLFSLAPSPDCSTGTLTLTIENIADQHGKHSERWTFARDRQKAP